MVKYHKSIYVVITFLILIGLVLLTGEAKTEQSGDQRLAGTTRFETARLVARESYAGGADTLYLAHFSRAADALVTGQAVPEGPILLAGTNPLPRATCIGVHELAPTNIVVVGGEVSIPQHNVYSANKCLELRPDHQEQRSLQLINQARQEHDLPPLAWDSHFAAQALEWSARAARERSNEHSGTGSDRWNENIAQGSNADHAHEQFMDSPGHRNNILGDWDAVGIGISVHFHSIWVVQQFVKY